MQRFIFLILNSPPLKKKKKQSFKNKVSRRAERPNVFWFFFKLKGFFVRPRIERGFREKKGCTDDDVNHPVS